MLKARHLQFNHSKTKVKQLADFLLDMISAEEFKSGDKLPSINNLSKRYNVSRDTVFKSFLLLRDRGVVDSIQGKSYYVASESSGILLVLDEYTLFKETLYNSLIAKLPTAYKIDLWFHQYNEDLFNAIINESYGKYSKYIVMNYREDLFSEALNKIDKDKLLLLDFGKFNKNGCSYLCQNFEEEFYSALSSVTSKLKKYKRLVYVLNHRHKHPVSSKNYFKKYCEDNGFEYEVLDEITENTVAQSGFLYIVVKQADVVNLIKQAGTNGLTLGKDFGMIAYNENPFYEVIGNGISSIGIDFKQMGNMAADFVTKNQKIEYDFPTTVTLRNSF